MLKFSQHAKEVRSTLDDFTKNINVNLRRQDENLNKAKAELNEQIEMNTRHTVKR